VLEVVLFVLRGRRRRLLHDVVPPTVGLDVAERAVRVATLVGGRRLLAQESFAVLVYARRLPITTGRR
jgi:hypothetical protein